MSLLPFWLLVSARFLPSKARMYLTDVSPKLQTLDLEKFSFHFWTLCPLIRGEANPRDAVLLLLP